MGSLILDEQIYRRMVAGSNPQRRMGDVWPGETKQPFFMTISFFRPGSVRGVHADFWSEQVSLKRSGLM